MAKTQKTRAQCATFYNTLAVQRLTSKGWRIELKSWMRQQHLSVALLRTYDEGEFDAPKLPIAEILGDMF